MNHRPHHNLTQMSHWIETDNRNRNSTKHCCYQVPWKDKSFWIHFKTEFSMLPSEDLFSTMYHSPTRTDSISPQANALAIRTSSLVWHSRVTLSRVELYLHFTLLFLKWYVWKQGSNFPVIPMISGPLLQRGYILPLCKCLFPGAFLLIKITYPFLFRIILPRSNRMNTLERLLNIAFMVSGPHISSHVPARVNMF